MQHRPVLQGAAYVLQYPCAAPRYRDDGPEIHVLQCCSYLDTVTLLCACVRVVGIGRGVSRTVGGRYIRSAAALQHGVGGINGTATRVV